MKVFATIVASLFALTAFAAEPAKVETTKPVTVDVKAKKVEPSKSKEPAVKDQKASAKPADTKPAAK